MIARVFTMAAIAAGFALPGSALAQNVTAQAPETVAQALQAAGYRAQLDTDSGGDPMIRSMSSGAEFLILFYGCTDNADCRTVQFYAGYSEPSNGSIEAMNEWNTNNRFGRAYATEAGSARIEMDLDLDDGGMSPELFTDNVEFWVAIMARFEEFIGY